MFSFLRTTESPSVNRDTEHKCGAPARYSRCALDWKREAPSHQDETSDENFPQAKTGHFRRSLRNQHRRDQLWLLIVSWKMGLLGIRVGEAAAPGPATTTQTQPIEANHVVSETRGGGRAQLREAYSDVPFSILRPAALDKESDESEFGHGSLSGGDIEEALSIPIQLYKPNQTTRNAISVSESGRRASQRRQSNFPQLPPDAPATEQGARFLPTDHRDTASDDTRRDPSHAPLGWKFCTMNMTAFSTQHLAIFELGCHVCGLQETPNQQTRAL